MVELPTASSDFQAAAAVHGTTIRAVKECIRGRKGYSRFRQRLLCHEGELSDDAMVPASCLQLVLLSPSPSTEDKAFLAACAENRWQQVEAMLQQAQDPNTKDELGRSALGLAVQAGHTLCAKLLLEAGASTQDAASTTLLHLAAPFGDSEVVRMLLDARADTRAADSDGATALHLAARYGHADVVRVLLGARADIKAADSDGATALHLAACYGPYADVTRVLLQGCHAP